MTNNVRTITLFFAVVVTALLCSAAANAAPGDPFSGASPAFDAAPEAGVNYNLGDWGVADQRGAATYTYPLEVPPGRNGMQPALALRYSSHAPLRGGLAAGWTMDIPTIERDYSLGADAGVRYRASVGSANGQLVEVADDFPFDNVDKAYRVNYDDTFTRFFRRKLSFFGTTYYWTVLTPDGVQHHFENFKNASDHFTRWYITRSEDSFGNTVTYAWSGVKEPGGTRLIDYRLDSIEYSANENAGLGPHAKVLFNYASLDLCSGSRLPIGAAFRRGSTTVTGSSRLVSITTRVRDKQGDAFRDVRKVALGYKFDNSKLYRTDIVNPLEVAAALPTFNCKQNLLRYLTEINVTGYAPDGQAASAPPITFEYNKRIDTSLPFFSPIQGTLSPKKVAAAGPVQYGDAHGAAGTLLDIDGDGLTDRVKVEEQGGQCTLFWLRGIVGGKFENNWRESPLPTIDWLNGAARDPNMEHCSLNGQVTFRSLGNGLIAKGTVTYRFLDFTGDGRIDLLTSVWATEGHEEFAPTRIDTIRSPASLASPQELVPGPGDAINSTPMTPEPGSGGTYRWRLFINGKGENSVLPPTSSDILSTNAWNINAPVPLPPTSSEVVIGSTYIQNYPIPPLFDIDGDGFLDAIKIKNPSLTGCQSDVLPTACDWTIYFGDGTTSFGSKTPTVWQVPAVTLGSTEFENDNCKSNYTRRQATVVDLRDMTGDGLPDLVTSNSSKELMVFHNTGSSFSNSSYTLGSGYPLEKTQTDCDFASGTLLEGARGYLRRLVDLDGDGLLDMVWFSNGGSVGHIDAHLAVSAQFNLGDRFGAAVLLPDVWLDVRRLLDAQWKPDAYSDYSGAWHVASDFVDINGDGHPDLAAWDDTTLTYIASPGLPHAPDLLEAVENGRGLRVTFAYAPSTDETIVARNSDKKPLSPNASWVVTQIRADAGLGTPPLVQRYSYHDPQFRSGSTSGGAAVRHQFAGFEVSETNKFGTAGQPDALVINAYEMTTANYSYRELEQVYHTTDNGLQRHSRTVTEETIHPLYADVNISLPTKTQTCVTSGPNQSWENCQARDDHNFHVLQTWERPSVTCIPNETCPTLPLGLFVLKEQIEGVGKSVGEGDRRTAFTYFIRYGQTVNHTTCIPVPDPCPGPVTVREDYRVLPAKTSRFIRDAGGNYEQVAQSVISYGVYSGLPQWTRVWRDQSTYATTLLSYDKMTGNRLGVRKPEQDNTIGGSGAWTRFEYDDHALFVRTTTNELGHVVTVRYDPGTGALLERAGPNSKNQTFERETWRIDGFGRPLAHRVSFDDDAAGYVLREVEQFAYEDDNFTQNGLPNRLRQKSLQDVGGVVWVTAEQTLDGMGRTLSSRQQVTNNQWAETTYTYDDQGNLASITTPDPSGNSATVTSAYAYDGLNRLTSFARPDGSGIDVSYNGLAQTVSEQTQDGTGGSRTRINDMFGRLTELREGDPDGPDLVTRYLYDGNDNLRQIMDADGNMTTIIHDWTGNRLSITRPGPAAEGGSRTWRYTYDLNGNLLSETNPVPSGNEPARHTVTHTYDDLDRLLTTSFNDPLITSLPSEPPPTDYLSYLPVTVDLQGSKSAAAAQIAINRAAKTEQTAVANYFYDEGVNGIGRLSRVELPLGQTSSPAGHITYSYDARGLPVREERSFSLSGFATASDSQWVERSFNAMGQLAGSAWDDGTRWTIDYDRRGLVNDVQWFDPQANNWHSVAAYSRNLSGLPIERNTAYEPSRVFAYDVLGRPVLDQIKLESTGAVIAGRTYSYTDSGDLAAVAGQTDGVSASASYTYDTHHRLLTASGPNGYQGIFSYSAAGNILTATVSWNGSQEARDVTYAYGDVDPQAVDRLTSAGGGSYARYSYDLAGNMVRRVTPRGATEMAWNSLNQIRLANGPNGAEIYLYDHDGARMLAISRQEGVKFWFGESETHYSLQGAQTRRYHHISAGGPALARIENGTKMELQFADALQNLMLSLQPDGGIAASFLYGAFGEIVNQTGAADHRRQFNGKENDAVGGLRYYGYRYYDPLILRWSSADPLYLIMPDLGLTEPQRLNLYTFSLNNPLRYYDPDGRDGNDRDKEETSCAELEPDRCAAEDADVEPTEDKELEESTKKEDKNSPSCNSGTGKCANKKDESPEKEIVKSVLVLTKEVFTGDVISLAKRVFKGEPEKKKPESSEGLIGANELLKFYSVLEQRCLRGACNHAEKKALRAYHEYVYRGKIEYRLRIEDYAYDYLFQEVERSISKALGNFSQTDK